MKNILLLTNSIKGLYNFRRELIEALIEQGYKVIISAPNDKRICYFKKLGCMYIETSIKRRGKNPFKDIKLLFKYIKIIKSITPCVVLTYTIKPNVYGGLACRMLEVPYITNITGLGTAVENKGFLQTITLFLYKISLKKANCVFLQNRANKEFLLNKKVISNKYKLIPGSGVNLKYFSLMKYPNGEKIHFLFVGRVMKEKGIDQYLEAATHIKDKYPNTVFHILGNCEDSIYIDKLHDMEKQGYIVYHGIQDDMRKFYEMSHCTVHPTYYPEGMSNVLLESCACGRPVITTNRSGCREIVDDKVTGFIVEQKNSQDLVEKIEEFLSLPHDRKKEMGLAGRAKVQRDFDRNIVLQEYFDEIWKIKDSTQNV